MPVILPTQRDEDGLESTFAQGMEFMQAYPAQDLQAVTM